MASADGEEQAALHREHRSVDLRERGAEAQHQTVGRGDGDVTHVGPRRKGPRCPAHPARRRSDDLFGVRVVLRSQLEDGRRLGSAVSRRRVRRRVSEHLPGGAEDSDVGLHDEREALGELVGVAPPLADPYRGPLRLLEESLIELSVQVRHERLIQREQRDHDDRDDEADVARQELRPERQSEHRSSVDHAAPLARRAVAAL